MMKIDDVLDDIVLLVLDGAEPLTELGITQKKIYAKVVGYDEFGMWILHPQFKIPKPTQKSSDLEKKPSFQTVNASMLIPWGFIVSVVHFPEVKGFDFPNPLDTHIGFERDK